MYNDRPIAPRLTLVVLFAVSLVSRSLAITITDPAAELAQFGLQTNVDEVMQYLQQGLPGEIKIRQQRFPDPYHSEANLPRSRWDRYKDCVRLLSDRQTMEASPILSSLVQKPLPEALMDDLYMQTAMGSHREDTWEYWDDAVAEQVMEIRSECVQALEKFEPALAGVVSAKLIEAEKEAVLRAINANYDCFWFVHCYTRICLSNAKVGRREGLNALFELLPEFKTGNEGGMSSILRFYTKIPIPLDFEMKDAAFAEAVADWKAWWKTNREHFELPPISPPKPEERITEFRNVRDYVNAASKEPMYGYTYPEAIAWLKANAAKNKKELRAIADDEDEEQPVRLTAARYYVMTGDQEALKWVRKRILVSRQSSASADALNPMILLQFIPESEALTKNEIILESVRRDTLIAPTAVTHLLHGEYAESNIKYLMDNYDRLANKYPELPPHIIQFFKAKPVDGDEKIIIDCLVNGNEFTAVFAVATIRLRSSHIQLPDHAQRAFARWNTDPCFALGVLEHLDEKTRLKEAEDIIQGLTKYDAETARAYTMGYRYFTKDFTGPITPEASACLAKIKKCVAAYRERR